MLPKLKLYLSAYLPALIWASIIFILSSQSVIAGFDTSVADFLLKKLAHMFVYAVLFVLINRAVELTTDHSNSKLRLWLPIFLCLIYAVTDEFHQSLVPGRYPTFRDVGYDMLGVTIAFLRINHWI